MKRLNSQAGFTLIELSISTAIFAMVLLLCVVGLLQISRLYYKAITSVRTQEVARSTIEEISRPIQFGSKPPANSPTTLSFSPAPADVIRSFCIGDQRYSYAIDAQVNDG